MKKLIIYGLMLATIITSFSACKKAGTGNLPDLERVPVVSVTRDATADVTISAVNQTAALAFSGKFTVDLFFKSDAPPEKVDVVVQKTRTVNGATTKKTAVFKQGVTNFPVTYTITGQDLATLFAGDTIRLGDRFEVGADIYANGKKYEAFPAVGVSYGSGVAGEYGGVSTTATYSAICKFVSSDWVGKQYKVVVDEWQDYSVGDPIAVTVIDATHISFKYLANNALPIVVTVNADNSLTVPRVQYGDYGNTGYGNFFVQTTSAGPNVIAPCDGTISLNLQHTVAAGSFGSFKIVIQRL